MRMAKEQILTITPKTLRKFAESEIVVDFYHGYDRSVEEGKREGLKVGEVYDMQSLFSGLEKNLLKYPDITVESADNYLLVSGKTKASSNNVENVERLEFRYYADENYVRITEDGDLNSYCQQLEFLDRLKNCIVFQILLWIQDDEALKACYLELLELLWPYHAALVEKKNEFLSVLLTTMTDIINKMPEEKAQAMPVTSNIPLLLYRLKTELESYALEESKYGYYENGLNMFFDYNELKITIGIDPATMNGMLFLLRDSKTVNIRILSASQFGSMIKELLVKINKVENLYCKLFASKAKEELYSLVYWAETE